MYTLYKMFHILAVILFFGAGLVSALNKIRADLSKDFNSIRFAHRQIVFLDLIFTIPSGILIPISGLLMVYEANLNFSEPFIKWGIILYLIAGLSWLPAWRIQYKLLKIIDAGEGTFKEEFQKYQKLSRAWALLGIPAGISSVIAIWVMVNKGF